jgi:hypothetical protein
MREKYIQYLNSEAIYPGRFDDLRDYTEYCNISSIISFDFLDMELTAGICRKKWGEYLDEQRFITYE